MQRETDNNPTKTGGPADTAAPAGEHADLKEGLTRLDKSQPGEGQSGEVRSGEGQSGDPQTGGDQSPGQEGAAPESVPEDLSEKDAHEGVKLGIIAGGGTLPLRLAQACHSQGRPFHVIGLEGLAAPALESFPYDRAALGRVGRILSILKDKGCNAVTMAGVVKRPDFSSLRLDLTGTRLLPRIVSAARGGDDQLLRMLVSYFEEQGFAVEGADDVLESLLSTEGVWGSVQPKDGDLEDLARAATIVTRLGDLDIGQATVVSQGVVLAVEAVEGTDGMLRRCAELPAHLRRRDYGPQSTYGPGGVLYKGPKPGQERRIDLPTIGVRTVELAGAAGLAGIGTAAGGVLVLDRGAVIEAADRLGLFIMGIPVSPARTGNEAGTPDLSGTPSGGAQSGGVLTGRGDPADPASGGRARGDAPE